MKNNSPTPNEIRPVVIVPTYNNAGTLQDILHRILLNSLPVIVVDDGSTDEAPGILERWTAEAQPAVLTVIRHTANSGKAAALRTGFDAASKSGYTHAVTIDSDGQLDPEQIPDLLSISRQNPQAFVIGARDASRSDYPLLSRLGRSISNFMIWIESGVRVSDSQCGFRIYPLAMFEKLSCQAQRYGYETEIIVKAAQSKIPILEAMANCRYTSNGEKHVSHFRVWRDTRQAIALHARLLLAQKREYIFGLLAICIGLILHIAGVFIFPFNSDEPQHLHVAWGWAHGLMQYRDVFDNHTPLFHIIFSFLVRLLGDKYDLLLWMRMAMLPLYGMALFCTYRIAKSLFTPRLGFWAVVLIVLFAPFLKGSTDFRTDNLWSPLFLTTIMILIEGRLSARRGFLAGLVLGATISVSMKTSLLITCMGAAGLSTAFFVGGLPGPAKSLKKDWKGYLCLIAGFLIIPFIIVAWFYCHGAFANLYYGAIQHNLLPNLGNSKGTAMRFRIVPAAIALLWMARRFIMRSPFEQATHAYVFLFLLTGLYLSAIQFLWPLITQQDYLPVWPFFIVLLLPFIDCIGQKQVHCTKGRAISLPSNHAYNWFAVLEMLLLIPAMAYYSQGHRVKDDLASWKAVLAMTSPSDTIMDPKGELIFRDRAFYWGLEGIARERLKRELIDNTINEHLIATRTCLVNMDLRRYPDPTRNFIRSNYISVGPVQVAGKYIEPFPANAAVVPFDIAIPTNYMILNAGKPAEGTIDGKRSRSVRFLSAGHHEYRPLHGEKELALIWAEAPSHGYWPTKPKRVKS